MDGPKGETIEGRLEQYTHESWGGRCLQIERYEDGSYEARFGVFGGAYPSAPRFCELVRSHRQDTKRAAWLTLAGRTFDRVEKTCEVARVLAWLYGQVGVAQARPAVRRLIAELTGEDVLEGVPNEVEADDGLDLVVCMRGIGSDEVFL